MNFRDWERQAETLLLQMTEVEHLAVLKSVVEASGGGLIDGVELLLPA